MKRFHTAVPVILAGLILAAANPAFAQKREFQSKEDLAGFLRERMPDFLKSDEQLKGLVAQILKTPLAPPLRQTFDPNRALKTLIPDGTSVQSTDCRRTATPTGERDPCDCTATIGDENGPGAFTRFSYSKSIGFGNIKFVKRPPVPSQPPEPEQLPAVKVTDAQALEEALKLLTETLGLPKSELPLPPAGAKGGLPVRNLNVQGGEDGKLGSPITIQKVVLLQRGFQLATPIPAGQGTLTHIPGPGRAMVMYGADGLAGLAVHGWQELRADPDMSEGDTKSGAQLMDEIAEDLFNEGVRSAADIKLGVLVGSDQRNQIGLLLPAVQVSVLPVPATLSEDEQRKLQGQTTAGLIREYSLVNRKEMTPTGRPRGE
jgi:hypothetical protein